MALLRDLPVELLTEIIYILFYDHDDETNPLNVLCINLLFKDLVLRLLYTHLRFRSTRQLSLFSQKKGPEELAYRPKTLTVTLAGGAADFDVFRQLAGVLKRCGAVSAEASENGNPKQVELDVLSLCLHSHERNPHLRYIYDALSLVKYVHFPTCFLPSNQAVNLTYFIL